MRTTAFVAALGLSALCWGQYVGNPAGKACPLSLKAHKGRPTFGFFGIEGGRIDTDIEGSYDVITGTSPGFLKETSNFEESYFALYGGGHFKGFELEAKIGGSFQEIREGALSADPFEDGGGILIGAGARWGFAPVEGFRAGVGGQFSFVYAEGDALVSDGLALYREDIELELWRGELFTGVSLDLPVGPELVLSPYAGVGVQFLDGELTIDEPGPWWYLEDEVADLDEDRTEFFFGGVDLHAGRNFRVGVEGRGNASGWVVTVSVGWRF